MSGYFKKQAADRATAKSRNNHPTEMSGYGQATKSDAAAITSRNNHPTEMSGYTINESLLSDLKTILVSK